MVKDGHGTAIVVGHGDLGGSAVGDVNSHCWWGFWGQLKLAVIPGDEDQVFAGVVGDGVHEGEGAIGLDGVAALGDHRDAEDAVEVVPDGSNSCRVTRFNDTVYTLRARFLVGRLQNAYALDAARRLWKR